MLRPNAVWLASCAIAVAIGTTSRAQEPGTRARDLFNEGREDVARGNVEEGCRKLLESHRLAPDALGPLLNVADCDEKAGRVATAWRRFTQAVELAPVGNDRRAYAEKRAAAVKDRVPHVLLELPPEAPAGTRVSQNGVALDPKTLQAPLALDPGTYRFVVSAPKHGDRAYQVALRERMEHRISLRLGDPIRERAAPPPRPPPDEPEPEGISTQALAGWITGGVGAAALVVGIVTGVLVAVHADVYEDHCDDDGACDDKGLAAASAGKPLAIVSPVMIGVGVAALAVAIPLVVTSPEMSASLRVTRHGTLSFSLTGAF